MVQSKVLWCNSVPFIQIQFLQSHYHKTMSINTFWFKSLTKRSLENRVQILSVHHTERHVQLNGFFRGNPFFVGLLGSREKILSMSHSQNVWMYGVGRRVCNTTEICSCCWCAVIHGANVHFLLIKENVFVAVPFFHFWLSEAEFSQWYSIQ